MPYYPAGILEAVEIVSVPYICHKIKYWGKKSLKRKCSKGRSWEERQLPLEEGWQGSAVGSCWFIFRRDNKQPLKGTGTALGTSHLYCLRLPPWCRLLPFPLLASLFSDLVREYKWAQFLQPSPDQLKSAISNILTHVLLALFIIFKQTNIVRLKGRY